MNKIKQYIVLLIVFISSFVVIRGIGGYLIAITDPVINTFLLAQSSISYNITFQPNNGDSSTTSTVLQNNPLGTLPTVSYNDCVGTTGDYHTRQCTYVYKFEGWYTESTFVNRVYEDYVPTGDITLYAKWNKIYYSNDGPVVFDGNNYINTEVMLFNKENAKKDFIVTFTVDEYTGYNPTNNKDKRASIFAAMNENDPYLGAQFFHDDDYYYVNVNSSANSPDRVKDPNTGYVTGEKVIFKRENGIVYYSYDDGVTYHSTVNFSSFTDYFDYPATFGAGLDNHKLPWRYMIGTLSDMSVEVIEPPVYTIHFEPNGGTGTMEDQDVTIGSNTTIALNEFVYDGVAFAGWNTEANGSGTSYPNGYTITSDLGNEGDRIVLYAQWDLPKHFYIHFEPNGGTGSMEDQIFTLGNPAVPLTQNTFTRTNYEFRGWNTEADKSGTHYDDEQAVRDLSAIDGDIITLYAEWWKIQFSHQGDAVFDGTQTTFIDTGVNVFSSTNLNKDFEIRFTFKSIDSDQLTYTSKQPTIFNVRDESNPKGPGFMLRFQNSKITEMAIMAKWSNSNSNATNINTIQTNKAPVEFIFKREGGVITAQYFYGNNQSSTVYTVLDQGSWTLNQPFATNVAFGGFFDGTNNNAPGRFFKGTLADIVILMDD